jgi:hypothetical protein
MRIKTVTIAVASVLLLLGFSACQQGTETTGMTAERVQATYTRADLERYVDRYMDAMMAQNVDPALFARNVRFTENGVELPLGEEGLWSNMVGRGEYRFYVPDVETNQVGFIGTAREESNTNPEEGDLVAVALRLKIVNGLITEVEQLVTRGDGGGPGGPGGGAGASIERLGPPHPIWGEVIPEENRLSREALIEIANKYYSTMQRNDGLADYSFFADDCHRLENGTPTTNVPLPPGQVMPDPKTSESYSVNWGCREQFESGLLHFVNRIRDRRFFAVDREHGIVFAFGFFDHSAGKTRHFTAHGREVASGPISPWTWQLAQVFKIENNQIRWIEATLHRAPFGMNSGWSTFERGWSDEMQIVR